MMDAAVVGRDIALVHAEGKRATTLRRFRRGDIAFKSITLVAAITVLVLLAGVMVALLHGSEPCSSATMTPASSTSTVIAATSVIDLKAMSPRRKRRRVVARLPSAWTRAISLPTTAASIILSIPG